MSLLRPIVLYLVIIILELPQYQFLEDLLEGDHAGGLETVLPHHHCKIYVFFLELVDSVKEGQILV